MVSKHFEICNNILEANGAIVADKAREILLKDLSLKELKEPLEFISKNWRDLTPALMALSCEAVGGDKKDTFDMALALSLMNLSFTTWDDIIDNSHFKSFKPTLLEEFGVNASLIIGGIASAKAFAVFNNVKIEHEKRLILNKLIWRLWRKMAIAETTTLQMRHQNKLSSKSKFWKMKLEAVDLETCLAIGAVIGNGSQKEINHLAKYGLYLGIILALRKDFHVALNLTSELSGKIKTNSLPYSMLIAAGKSSSLKEKLEKQKNLVCENQMGEIIKEFLEMDLAAEIRQRIVFYTKKAENELSKLNVTKASTSLQRLVQIQPQLYNESLLFLPLKKNRAI